MPFTPRTKKYTDYAYLETNPASEDAVREQMEGAVDEVFEIMNTEAALKVDLGTVASLTTTVKTSAVAAINELDGEIGTLASLTTTNKSNLVAAINEHDSEIGTLASLGTTDKTNLVAAINEVRTENRTTPTPSTISTGFLATWSGSIIHRKNLEGLKNLNFNLDRSSDILNTSSTIYTLPAELRPTETTFFFFQGLSAGGSAIPDSSISLTILTDGQMLIYSSGTVTANVRKTVGNISYY